jgi:hypothetical protein
MIFVVRLKARSAAGWLKAAFPEAFGGADLQVCILPPSSAPASAAEVIASDLSGSSRNLIHQLFMQR